MSRTKINVDKEELINIIANLEKNRVFTNLSSLYEEVCKTGWAEKFNGKLTPSVVGLRVREFNIEPQTKPGKIGGGKGSKRKNKIVNFSKTFNYLKDNVPERYLARVKRASKGSIRAIIDLKCLDCTCYQNNEVKNCECVGCPLFPVRPFQSTSYKVEK